jgi:tyrosyl-tRNA synthetase
MNTAVSNFDRLTRGLVGLYSADELAAKLKGPRPLRVKYGMDPTAPDIHLGHTVQMRKLRQFQDLGHVVVLIIGDYTARIGDPSGRDATRPVLEPEEIESNARTYLEQAGKVLDTSPAKLEVRRNGEWLSKLHLAEVLKLTGQVTVQQMLHRENFRQRLKAETEIVISEFMYPLMQAYDSVAIEADIEFGGSDQTFNCLLGRELMAKQGLEKQVVMITPLLVGLDGREKMSKSKGNYIGLTDSADDMFGKVMSIPDTSMGEYFQLLTDLPEDQIADLVDDLKTHPRDAKDILARVVLEPYHGCGAANSASSEFRRRFSEHQLPSDMQTVVVAGTPLRIIALIRQCDFAASNGEARRLVEQGAVSIDGQKVTDPQAEIACAANPILKVGKRRICRVEVG